MTDTNDTTNTVSPVTPTLTLPLQIPGATGPIEAYKLWVSIPANDETGVLIDNVMKDDVVIIYDASGIASFKESKMKFLKSIVGLANAIAGDTLLYATDGAAAPFLNSWNTATQSVGDAIGDTVKHGRRDAYGRDPGTGDYATHEGGLIVCMPESKGVIYATSDYYLLDGSKSNGRQYQYYSQAAIKMNILYPSNSPGGLLSKTATIPGAVHVLAFDSTFTDNAGAYKVGMLVVRGYRPSGRSVEQVSNALTSAAPYSGGVY